MAYTELTCDEAALPLEELLRGAMKLQEDGTYSLQVVNITDGVTSFTITSGSVTDTYTYDFDSEGRPAFVRQGFEGDADEGNPIWSVFWTESDFGFGWYMSNAAFEVLYYSLDDVATPDLCTTWVAVAGSNPLPVFT